MWLNLASITLTVLVTINPYPVSYLAGLLPFICSVTISSRDISSLAVKAKDKFSPMSFVISSLDILWEVLGSTLKYSFRDMLSVCGVFIVGLDSAFAMAGISLLDVVRMTCTVNLLVSFLLNELHCFVTFLISLCLLGSSRPRYVFLLCSQHDTSLLDGFFGLFSNTWPLITSGKKLFWQYKSDCKT